MPKDRHLKNCGGSDGSGLCVFTSINHAADWQNVVQLVDLQKWMRSKPGGGYPDKVDQMISEKCGQTKPNYIQINVDNRSDVGKGLDFLQEAVKLGYMPSVTYCKSPTGRYSGKSISHMVNLVGARVGPNKYWFILDNNYPGTYEIMTEKQFVDAWFSQGYAWAVLLLKEGPPPIPCNNVVGE